MTTPPPEDQGPQAVPLTAGGAVLLVLVHFAAFTGVVLLGGIVSSGETVPVAFRVAAVLIAPLAAIYVGLVRHAPQSGTMAALHLGPPPAGAWPSLALAVVCGAALGPLVTLIYEVLLKLIPLDGDPETLTTGEIVLISFAHVFAAALLEALFRGLLQPRLIPALGVRRGLVVSVVVFMIAQLNALTIPVAALSGTVTGIIVLSTGTTWAAIAACVAMQLVVLFMPDATPPVGLVAAGVAVAAAALLGIWWRRPQS